MGKILDLTHPVTPGMTTWPGDPEVERRQVADLLVDGYALGATTIGDHTGTHIGVGAHLDPDGITLDRLPLDLLIRTAVVVGLTVATDLTPAMLLDWERNHGSVEPGSVVLVRTGRSREFGDRMSYRGTRPGTARLDFPGVTLAAARLLGDDRGVVGLGIDTLGIDPGHDEHLSTNRYWLQGHRYHLENLTNLEGLPPRGITLYVAPLPIAGASGAPARVLAVID